MSFRVSALVAGLAVLGLAEASPVLAQPQAPVRPRYSSFGSIFSPSRGPNGQQLIGNAQMQPFVNPLGPQVVGGQLNQGGFVLPGSGAAPGAFPGVYAIDPLARPTGIVGSFNNLGHWYGGGYTGGGYYGHWYPGGVTNGRGILGYGGGGLGGGGAVVLPTSGGAGPRVGGPLMSTAFTAGATINQFRR